MQAFRRQIADSAAAIRAVFRNPNLRWIQLASLATNLGNWGYTVGVSLYAYKVGGVTDVGIIWLLRTLPASLLAPIGGVIADRFPRQRVMLSTELIRAPMIVAGAVCIWSSLSPDFVYAIATANSIVRIPFRPSESALMPQLAETPSQLTGANVAASTIDSVGFFAGPAIAGLVLAVSSIQVAFVVTAGAILMSAFFVSRIRLPRPEGATEPPVAEPIRRGVLASLLAESSVGFKTLLLDSRLRLLVGLLGSLTLVVGAMEVMLVAIALQLLHIGSSGVGYLNAMFGVGALLGAVVGAGLIGVRRLATPFVAGALVLAVPIAVIGISPHTGVAYACFALVGVGNTVVDVAGFTLVQRAVPHEVLGRVFGVLQLVWMSTLGIGAILAPALISGFGLKSALIVTGFFVPVLVILLGPHLVRIDREATAPEVERINLIRGTPFFAPLPGAMIETLASRLIPQSAEAASVIIREGDPGDRFYLVAEGQVDVASQGAHVATLGVGDFVGEIALLHDVPRTATVTAITPVRLYALERDDFLATVTSHAPSREAAESVVASRLSGLRGATGRLPLPGI